MQEGVFHANLAEFTSIHVHQRAKSEKPRAKRKMQRWNHVEVFRPKQRILKQHDGITNNHHRNRPYGFQTVATFQKKQGRKEQSENAHNEKNGGPGV